MLVSLGGPAIADEVIPGSNLAQGNTATCVENTGSGGTQPVSTGDSYKAVDDNPDTLPLHTGSVSLPDVWMECDVDLGREVDAGAIQVLNGFANTFCWCDFVTTVTVTGRGGATSTSDSRIAPDGSHYDGYVTFEPGVDFDDVGLISRVKVRAQIQNYARGAGLESRIGIKEIRVTTDGAAALAEAIVDPDQGLAAPDPLAAYSALAAAAADQVLTPTVPIQEATENQSDVITGMADTTLDALPTATVTALGVAVEGAIADTVAPTAIEGEMTFRRTVAPIVRRYVAMKIPDPLELYSRTTRNYDIFGAAYEERMVCYRYVFKCARASRSKADAEGETFRRYGAPSGYAGWGDAFRHCYWSALMTKRAGYDFAVAMGNAHEKSNWRKGNNTYDQYVMDIHNNHVGRQVGLAGGSDRTLSYNSWVKQVTRQLRWVHNRA